VPREKQIEFPPEQTHTKWFEYWMFAISFACIIAVIIIVLTYEKGSFIGPWG
jgi:hypothetical protein